jgi:DNA-binding beta-propeller fold protein YncE
MTSPSARSLSVLLSAVAVAAALASAAAEADSKYPRVNTVVGYEVNPEWPQRPTDVTWEAVPGVAVDKNDHVYVFTRAKPPVQVYDAGGKFLRSFGQGTVKSAHQIRIDPEGNVWAADIGHHQIHKFTAEGKHLMSLGTKDHPGDDETHFNMPTDMAVTPAGDVFVSDGYGNSRVVHFDKAGRFVKQWGELGSKPGQFSLPHAIVVDSKGRLYVADRNNVRVQVFDQKGNLLAIWGNVVIPWGLCVTKDDDLWVCGTSPARWRPNEEYLGSPPKDQLFMRFNAAGKLLQLWAVPKGVDGLEQPGELNWVHGVAVDSKGNLYAGDIKGKRAQKFVRKEP